MTKMYSARAPARSEVDSLVGAAMLDFGTNWCGYCRAAQPLVAEAHRQHPKVRHIMIEDGKGRQLGRSFGVKLWPTLIFLRDGREVARLVRPDGVGPILEALAEVDG